MQTGTPLSVNAANDNLGFGGNTTNHADRVGPITYPHTFSQWFSPTAFAQPAPLTWGNGARNTVKGPGRNNWNLSLYKDFHIGERAGFQFRAETLQYLEPYPVHRGEQRRSSPVPLPTPTTPLLGQINATGDPRVFQFGGKDLFLGDSADAPQPWRTGRSTAGLCAKERINITTKRHCRAQQPVACLCPHWCIALRRLRR